MHWNNKDAILTLIKRLVKIPSVAGTEQENDMADKLIDILKEIPYFAENEGYIYQQAIKGDSLGRRAIAALVKGTSSPASKTVILMSHYDVVGVDDYGYLKSFAFDPDEYTERLKQETLPVDVREDLESGNWLFARGIMDMKAGLAVQIALLSELCQDRNFEGNVLLLSTPDEERNSEGMLAAVKLLRELQQEAGLQYELAICSEPSFSRYPGDDSKYLYLGSVGKLLPLLFCSGRETHVGEPFEGLNAAWMAAAFVNNMELSDQFIEKAGTLKNPPPMALKLMDLKEHYNVQTPKHSYVLYNVLTLLQTPQDVMQKLKDVADKSAMDILAKLKRAYLHAEGAPYLEYIEKLKPKTYTYSELYDLGMERHGDVFVKEMDEALLKSTAMDFDYRDLTVAMAKTISGYFQDLEPFYLLLFAPPFYPHVSLQSGNVRDDKIIRVTEQIISLSLEKFNQEIKLQQYFMGLSDVSYCRLLEADQVIPALSREMPLYGIRYNLPLQDINELDIPTINLGPYGKDAHKRTERLELTFSLQQFPHLLKEAVTAALQ
ncbi:M20/M25/M40 family metallo-hydrolase [Peribacillus sp. SCS-155]|uniref:M20/M25/M40 family metallo-hydrolase n=1 Tax=Peribacillus sedimenti TaxID=3115297 RepID=UPI0039064DA0